MMNDVMAVGGISPIHYWMDSYTVLINFGEAEAAHIRYLLNSSSLGEYTWKLQPEA